jgi:hypothetical protein
MEPEEASGQKDCDFELSSNIRLSSMKGHLIERLGGRLPLRRFIYHVHRTKLSRSYGLYDIYYWHEHWSSNRAKSWPYHRTVSSPHW